MDIATLRDEILKYKPGNAVACDDGRVVFPDKLVIGNGVNNEVNVCLDLLHGMRYGLHGQEKADELMRADKRQTSTENQQEFWITNYISVIETSRPDTGNETSEAEGTEGAIRDLAEKVGCMVKILNTLSFQVTIEEIKKIKEMTGRFPVCAILHNDYGICMKRAIDALKGSGVTDYCVIPFHSDRNKLQWLHLLHKCLQEGDRVLAANDLKKICKNPRCESFYEKTKKDLEEANQEKRSLQHKIKELEQKLQESLASREGNDKALDKAMDEALGNWKRTTKRQLESEIRSAKQKKKAGTPQQM